MDILSLLSALVSGSSLGAIGAAVSRWQSYKFELEKLKELNATEITLAKLASKTQIAIVDSETSSQLQMASYEADMSKFGDSSSGKFVDAVRGLTRPVLTLFLVLMTCLLAFILLSSVELAQDQAYELLTKILDGLVSCTGMALAWWFGTRKV